MTDASSPPAFRVRAARQLVPMSRFGVVGLIGLGLNSGLLWLLTEHAHLFYLVSSVIATEAAIINNFALNHLWTFNRSRRAGSVAGTFLRYNTLALSSLVLTVAMLFVLTHFVGIFYLLANVLAVGLAGAWNYLVCHYWIWNAPRPATIRLAQAVADD